MSSQKQDMSNLYVGIWIGAGIAVVGAAFGSGIADQGINFWVVSPMFIALLATIVVMLPSIQKQAVEGRQSVERHSAPEKMKNQSPDQLGMLLSLMDEDEIVEFKERLKDRVLADAGHLSDGEMAYDAGTLEALLGEDDQQAL